MFKEEVFTVFPVVQWGIVFVKLSKKYIFSFCIKSV